MSWQPMTPGLLQLPSGRLVRGRGLGERPPEGPPPEWGVYLLDQRPPVLPWPAWWVHWPDFGVPSDPTQLRAALEDAWQRAESERVELACWGGHGRTGTALVCLAVLDGARQTSRSSTRGSTIAPQRSRLSSRRSSSSGSDDHRPGTVRLAGEPLTLSLRWFDPLISGTTSGPLGGPVGLGERVRRSVVAGAARKWTVSGLAQGASAAPPASRVGCAGGGSSRGRFRPELQS